MKLWWREPAEWRSVSYYHSPAIAHVGGRDPELWCGIDRWQWRGFHGALRLLALLGGVARRGAGGD